jgi:hypothetical protein
VGIGPDAVIIHAARRAFWASKTGFGSPPLGGNGTESRLSLGDRPPPLEVGPPSFEPDLESEAFGKESGNDKRRERPRNISYETASIVPESPYKQEFPPFEGGDRKAFRRLLNIGERVAQRVPLALIIFRAACSRRRTSREERSLR